MKKLVSLLLALVMIMGCVLPICVSAKVGDVVGTAVHTDIVAYINHNAIPSYAANGQSCIVAEDLRKFGFDVIWDGNARTLSIYRSSKFYADEMVVDKSAQSGAFFSNILATDIKVYANGQQLTSYALNGYTMIPIEQLTMFGQVNWVPEERAIKLWIEGFNQRATKQQPIVTLYGVGGKTIKVEASEVEKLKASGWSTQPLPDFSASLGIYDHSQQYNCFVVISEYDGYNIAFEIQSSNHNASRIASTYVRSTVNNGVCYFRFEDSWGVTGNGTLEILGNGKLNLSLYNIDYGTMSLWSVAGSDGNYYRSGDLPYDYEPWI